MPEQFLYLARHAHALDDAPSDAKRPLSPKGHTQVARLCAGLKRSGLLQPAAIWHSSLVRARETAEGLAQGLGLDAPLSRKTGFAPYDQPAQAAAKLDKLGVSCLVVGHEPNLSAVATLLLGGDPSLTTRVIFDKAAILCLARMVAGAQATPWQVQWHLSHKLFKK